MKKRCDISFMILWIAIVILVTAMILAIGVYRYYFNGKVSLEHTHWAEFGSYIAGIAGVLNFVAFLVLTFVIHNVEKKQADRSMRFRAEELAINKMQFQLEIFNNLQLKFQKENPKEVAGETYDRLQPLMAYLSYLKGIELLPTSTREIIEDVHKYLMYEGCEILIRFTNGMEGEDGKMIRSKQVLEVYEELYRSLEKLEVKMIADIAEVTFEDKEVNHSGKNKSQIN